MYADKILKAANIFLKKAQDYQPLPIVMISHIQELSKQFENEFSNDYVYVNESDKNNVRFILDEAMNAARKNDGGHLVSLGKELFNIVNNNEDKFMQPEVLYTLIGMKDTPGIGSSVTGHYMKAALEMPGGGIAVDLARPDTELDVEMGKPVPEGLIENKQPTGYHVPPDKAGRPYAY